MNRFREMGLIKYNGTLQVHKTLRTFLLQGSFHPDGLATTGIDAGLVETDATDSTDKPVLVLPKAIADNDECSAEGIKLNQADPGADL
jgi:hypothetical protein